MVLALVGDAFSRGQAWVDAQTHTRTRGQAQARAIPEGHSKRALAWIMYLTNHTGTWITNALTIVDISCYLFSSTNIQHSVYYVNFSINVIHKFTHHFISHNLNKRMRYIFMFPLGVVTGHNKTISHKYSNNLLTTRHILGHFFRPL